MTREKEFSKEDIDYISKLALLDLSDEEKEKLSQQLSNILSHFKKLNDLDTTNIDPMTHPIETLKNVFRKDEIKPSLSNEEALKNAQHRQDGYFKAPRILKD
ncbi:MAG: Asp-tRNA(Asn)/Glu-tRNA(Gln) amidotransferase subunit GatC [Promethearchaeota archaeon]